VIVDLTGLPGAGKTTLEKCLISELAGRGQKVLTRADVKTSYIRKNFFRGYRRESGLHIPFRILLYLRLAAGFLRACRARGLKFGPIFRPGRFSPCLWLYEDTVLSGHFLAEREGAESGEVLFFPREGIVHHSACVRVWAGELYAALNERWLSEFSAGGVLILHVQVPEEEALRRLQVRGLPETWPGPAQRTASGIMPVLASFNEAIRESLAEFEAAGARVLAVDGTADPSAQARKIISAIETMRGMPAQ